MDPGIPSDNLADNLLRNSKQFADSFVALPSACISLSNLSDDGLVNPTIPMFFAAWRLVTQYVQGVAIILGLRAVLKIDCARVHANTIKVIYYVAGWARSYEQFSHERMDKNARSICAIPQLHLRVIARVRQMRQYTSKKCFPAEFVRLTHFYLSFVRNLVVTAVAGDVFPLTHFCLQCLNLNSIIGFQVGAR
jgi:hypothetical protein